MFYQSLRGHTSSSATCGNMTFIIISAWWFSFKFNQGLSNRLFENPWLNITYIYADIIIALFTYIIKFYS